MFEDQGEKCCSLFSRESGNARRVVNRISKGKMGKDPGRREGERERDRDRSREERRAALVEVLSRHIKE